MKNGRFPRSMLEAWPHHYPHSIQHFKPTFAERVADHLTAITIGLALAALLFVGLSK